MITGNFKSVTLNSVYDIVKNCLPSKFLRMKSFFKEREGSALPNPSCHFNFMFAISSNSAISGFDYMYGCVLLF